MADLSAPEPTPRTTSIVALHPVSTAALAVFQGGLQAVDAVASPSGEALELLFALPWLPLSFLLYLSFPFVTALLVELGRSWPP